MSTFLDIDRRGRVLEITLNRTEKRNALNQVMCESIVEACEAAESDPFIGAILLRANGAIFSAGMDLDEATAPDASESTASHGRLFTLGSWLTKPVICSVQGPALGGGLGLVANAHIAIAAHGTTFGLTEIRIGMWPYAVYQSLVSALGSRRTLELTLTSKIFNTPEALAWGLIQEVVPAYELDERAEAIAQALANASTATIVQGMRFVQESRKLDAASATELALRTRAETFQSQDFAEGVQAFKEKRTPVWPSHS